jgi:hypothetical protein
MFSTEPCCDAERKAAGEITNMPSEPRPADESKADAPNLPTGGDALGIDLGTTYSCVAIWQHDRVEIIANEQGNRTTPSYVAFTATEHLTGEAAVSQAETNAESTVFDAKRLIGRKFRDPTVQADMKHWFVQAKHRPFVSLSVICLSTLASFQAVHRS